jgi:cell division protein FtsB
LVHLKRFILPALVGLAVYFAVFGGEYSLLEVRQARAEREDEAARLAALGRVNDSLRAWGDSLEADSATIERVARERYGMIREGEVLYRIAPPPDSTGDSDGR